MNGTFCQAVNLNSIQSGTAAAVPGAVQAENYDTGGPGVGYKVNIPATGAWQTRTTVTTSITLPAGKRTLTLDQDNGGWDINYLKLS